MERSPNKSNQSVDKTLCIIEALAEAREPLRLSQLAASVRMPASTVLRMVSALAARGYVYQEDGELRRYGLTLKFAWIGQMIAENLSVRSAAHPILTELSRASGEACCLAAAERGVIRYLDVVEGASKSLIAVRQRVGGVAPMHCTGSGKLALSRYGAEELAAYLDAHPLEALAPRTITSPARLRDELEAVRRNGYAVDDEECEAGVRCVAAPILSPGGELTAALSLSGPVSRMDDARLEAELIPLVRGAARRIEAKLYGI